MTDLPEKLNQLLKMLEITEDSEIDCDEFWDKAAWLAETEIELNAEQVKSLLHHIRLCSGCREDFELLHNVVVDFKQHSNLKN